MNSALVRFLILLSAGFLAAAATGKLVPHARWLSDTYVVSLGMAGFAISAVMLPGAALSFGLGHLADRFGARRVAVTGLLAIALASSLLGAATTFPVLIGLRLVEGLGYCLLVVAATMLVVETSTPHRRTLALSVWSSFAPIGFALGQWAAASIESVDRLATIGQAHAIFLLAAAIVVWLGMPQRRGAHSAEQHSASPSLTDSIRHIPAWRSSLAFGCSTGILLAAVAVTPLVLARNSGVTIADAARYAALAALPGIAGRFAAGWLLGRGLSPAAILTAAGSGGALAIALVLIAPLPLAAALGLFTSFQLLMGIIPGVLSAMIPSVAPSPAHIGSTSGLVNQMVTLGNLAGPPLILATYAAAGEAGAALLLASVTAVCVVMVARLDAFRRPAV